MTVSPRRPNAVSPLARCVGDADAFLRDVWGRRAVVLEGSHRSGFAELLSLDDVDRFLTTTALRVPFVRLVQDGAPIPESSYTRTGRTGSRDVAGIVDPARAAALFEGGATIVLQGLHRWSPSATRFVRDLELELGHLCQINAYITPPGAQGLALHADPHDVLVLQAFGHKRWEIHAAPGESARPPVDARLEPGDVAYLPAGTQHAASAQEVVSGHLTVGIHVGRWSDVVAKVASDLAREAEATGDDAVPAGWHRDVEGFGSELAKRLRALADRLEVVDPGPIAEGRADRFWSGRAQLARGTIAERAAAIEVDDGTMVRRREGAVCELRVRGDTLVVLLGDRRLEMPAWVEPAMRRIATLEERHGPRRDTIAVGDLARELPDPASRAVLVGRLIREGLLTAAPR